MWIVFSNGCATRRGVLVTFDACLCDRILIPFSASVLSRPFLWFSMYKTKMQYFRTLAESSHQLYPRDFCSAMASKHSEVYFWLYACLGDSIFFPPTSAYVDLLYGYKSMFQDTRWTWPPNISMWFVFSNGCKTLRAVLVTFYARLCGTFLAFFNKCPR